MDTPRGPVEVVLRPMAEDQKDGASIVGLFADEPELMDEVSQDPSISDTPHFVGHAVHSADHFSRLELRGAG